MFYPLKYGLMCVCVCCNMYVDECCADDTIFELLRLGLKLHYN